MASSYLDALDTSKITLACATLGLLSTAVFYSMNTTINYLTMPTILLGGPPPSVPSAKVQQHHHHQPHAAAVGDSKSIIPATTTPASHITHLNRQWQEVYWRAHRVGPASAIFSGLILGATSYLSSSRPSASSSSSLLSTSNNSSWLFATAAVVAISAYPFTVVAMVPTNDELHRRGDAITRGLETDGMMEESKAPETAALIAKWIGLSKVRANIALVAMVLVFAGMLSL